jgi:multiple sugar transport system substrate-binding protein
MRRKLVIGAALSAIPALLAVSACGGESGADSTDSDEPVTLRLALEASGDTAMAYEEQTARFNDAHPDVTVELQTYAGGDAYNKALLGQAAGGDVPDVFLLDGGKKTQEFAATGAIQPLDGPAQAAGLDLDEFQSSLLDAFRVEGELYAIPKDYSSVALMYHEDMLAEAGVEPPETWAELRAAARDLTTGDRFGLGMYPQINYALALVESADGGFLTESGVDNVDNSGHVEAVRLLEQLFVEDESTASPQMTGASWDGEMFDKGDVAMVIGGTWIPGSVSSEDVGIAPVPIDERPGAVLYTAGWAVSADAAHPDRAMDLITFLSSDEELLAGRSAGVIQMPPTASAMEKWQQEDPDDAVLQVVEETVEHSVPFGWLTPQQVETYNRALSELIDNPGSTTPEDLVAQLAEQLPESG